MTESLPDNFPALVERASREFGASEAISDGDVSLDFAELGRRIDRASAALVASGISPGDRVAVWAPNSWEWVVAAMAVFGAGAVLVPVNTRFKGREAAFVLQKAEVKTLFTVVGFLGNDYVTELSESGENVESLEDVVILRGDTPEGTVSFQDFLNRGSDADQREARDRASRVLGSDLGLIMFTSGTTGVPKGVMVEQGPIIRGFSHYARELGMRQGDRMLIVNPFFHAFGFNGAINPCFIHGATMLPHPVFDVPAVLQRIQDDKVTVFPGPPAIFQGLINYKELDRYDISSLRSAVTGAASIPVETVVDMRDLLGFDTVVTAYGMTETHGLVTICAADDPPEVVAATSGKALPGIELKLIDDDGDEVAVGQPGELLVKGYAVMRGYLDEPEQTAETIDKDGWMRTGDICVMNPAGYIDITDRKKDMFINGGFNTYPAEIESTMLEHEAVGQVAVIGVPDERLGEVGAAFVVAAPTGEPDLDELARWCKKEMANYKVPRYFWIVEELPLNPSNKVLKTELREKAATLLA
ncbi:MAG: fatty acid--CoA ligase [Acidimicrobiaceae bacterium]|jgi:acyl-CoA synthetase (AMP-forming)/AMP-acid ligase II|nr:fatty acid--CoA ligase [Acidimicrobiaceae bacterium]